MNSKCNDAMSYDRLVLILGLAGFISAADNWFVSPILPAIASGFGVSVSKAGLIITAYMLPYGIMQPIYGFFSDRYSKVKTLQLIVGGLAIGTALCAIAPSLEMLCAFRTITGFFAAGIIAVSLALIGDMVPDVQRQAYVGRFMGIVFLGQGISTGLGGFFAKFFSWRIALIFFCIAAIIITALLRDIPSTILGSKNGNFFSEVIYAVMTTTGRIIFPLAFLTGFLLLGIYSYLGVYLHEGSGINYLQIGLVMMFYGFACLLAGALVGKYAKKIGRYGTILVGGCFALCSALLLTFFHSWQAGLLSVIILGFGYIFIQSTLATMALEVSSKSKGLLSGLIGFGLFCGGGIGTSISGWVLSITDYKKLWLILAVGIVIFIIHVLKLCFDDCNNDIKNIGG